MGLLSKVGSSPCFAESMLKRWGTDPGYNPAAEAFKNFDQDQPSSLLGSLHLDTDDEPRRGASRANSVRFDESALHSHFGHTARSSTECLPVRTGSGIGSHPMTERSSSHKSDGRQSSAGQSTQSARASSFGLESRPLSATVAPFIPMGPPPGLFILGPVPSIIRCWLDTKFSNETLLYAAVCTGSYKSVLDLNLVIQLGFEDKIVTSQEGEKSMKIPVYLPEATIQQSSSRNYSSTQRLPTLTTEFMVQSLPAKANAIQVFLGCDILRAQSADIHFSLDRMTLFDGERNKVAVPLVRPENATAFRDLRTANVESDAIDDLISAKASNGPADLQGTSLKLNLDIGSSVEDPYPEDLKTHSSSMATSTPLSSAPSVIGEGRKSEEARETSHKPMPTRTNSESRDSETLANGTNPDTPTKPEGASIWGSWRRDALQNGRQDPPSSVSTTTSGYQRAGRGRGMKVLKPARLHTTRSPSTQHPPVGFDAAPARALNSLTKTESSPATVIGTTFEKAALGDSKSLATSKPRSANPVGGASAFGWLNSNEQKPSATASSD